MCDGRAESASTRTLAPCEGYVHDEAGKEVRNERGAALRTRRRADGSVGQDVRWTAILVEGKRIDGRPCQNPK